MLHGNSDAHLPRGTQHSAPTVITPTARPPHRFFPRHRNRIPSPGYEYVIITGEAGGQYRTCGMQAIENPRNTALECGQQATILVKTARLHNQVKVVCHGRSWHMQVLLSCHWRFTNTCLPSCTIALTLPNIGQPSHGSRLHLPPCRLPLPIHQPPHRPT